MPRFFTTAETVNLSPKLVSLLDSAREIAGITFVITCGWRSAEYNTSIGGAPNSAHTRGLAVDLSCRDSATRFRMVPALYQAGFKRIELAPWHIHVDCDETLAQNVLWLGDDK